ncbi:transmembrane protein 163-like [Crassostrea angulata]|uniref:transmembrane protein 163-like n=1 Tax=Magallana angulata TaxID=2784310 RepID=UPI0022B0BF7F|nr:transmembrane protein 163-like [Crassostrea angulata]
MNEDAGSTLQKCPTYNNAVENEKAELLLIKHRAEMTVAVQLRKAAIVISWVSVVFGFAQGLTATVYASTLGSDTIFGFGLNAILDSLSSIVVLWRFHSNDLYSESREQKACFVIAILFVASSTSLLTMTIISLVRKEKEKELITLEIISLTNGVCNLVLGTLKSCLGYKLESKSLMTDSIITFVGFLMSLSAFLAINFYVHDASLWYIDHVFAIVCSVLLYLFAIRFFCQQYLANDSHQT